MNRWISQETSQQNSLKLLRENWLIEKLQENLSLSARRLDVKEVRNFSGEPEGPPCVSEGLRATGRPSRSGTSVAWELGAWRPAYTSCERLNGLFNAHLRQPPPPERPFYSRESASNVVVIEHSASVCPFLLARSIDSPDIVRSRIDDSTVPALSIAATVFFLFQEEKRNRVPLTRRGI